MILWHTFNASSNIDRIDAIRGSGFTDGDNGWLLLLWWWWLAGRGTTNGECAGKQMEDVDDDWTRGDSSSYLIRDMGSSAVASVTASTSAAASAGSGGSRCNDGIPFTSTNGWLGLDRELE